MIQLNHVYKTFFKGKDMEVRALDDVTMTVKDGDFVTITQTQSYMTVHL